MSKGTASMPTNNELIDALQNVTEALANTLLHHGQKMLPADLSARRKLVQDSRVLIAGDAPGARIEIACGRCGSDDVGREATARWDVSAQAWALGSVFDDGFCDNCNGDANLIERPVTG